MSYSDSREVEQEQSSLQNIVPIATPQALLIDKKDQKTCNRSRSELSVRMSTTSPEQMSPEKTQLITFPPPSIRLVGHYRHLAETARFMSELRLMRAEKRVAAAGVERAW